MIKKITEKELSIQNALGSLPEEYRIALCRYRTPTISKGLRRCHLCGLKCIHKGEEFYKVSTGKGNYNYADIYINICKTCSWLTIQTINRIIGEYNANPNNKRA